MLLSINNCKTRDFKLSKNAVYLTVAILQV